jgi:hypothetical protein
MLAVLFLDYATPRSFSIGLIETGNPGETLFPVKCPFWILCRL